MCLKMYTSFWVFFMILVFKTNYTSCESNCVVQNNYIKESYAAGAYWAREFYDTFGKFPSGIFSGNRYDFGHFDQCINFHYQSELFKEVQGQYCLVIFPYDVNSKNSDVSLIVTLEPYV